MRVLSIGVAIAALLSPGLVPLGARAAENSVNQVGKWSTVKVPTPRSYHTATVLRNGNVLIAGGCVDFKPDGSCDSATRTAEIFDVVKKSWKSTGDMNIGRARNTALLLPNGKVVVMGVEGDDTLRPTFQTIGTLSAEIYDPARGTWTKARPSEAHVFRELVAFGPDIPNKYEFKSRPTNLIPSFYTTSATLIPASPKSRCGKSCGKILSVGLYAQLYDPKADKWAVAGETGLHVNHTTSILKDGQILVTADGGREGVNPGEIFNPLTEKFDLATDEPVKRVFQTTTLLGTGKVLVAGGLGSGSGGSGTPSAEVFDSQKPPSKKANAAYASERTLKGRKAKGSWRPAKPMAIGRMNHAAVVLKDGRVLVVGGNDKFGPEAQPLASAELYNPKKGTWSSEGQMANARGAAVKLSGGGIVVSGATFTATRLKDGSVLVLGGNVGSAEVYFSASRSK